MWSPVVLVRGDLNVVQVIPGAREHTIGQRGGEMDRSEYELQV